VAADLAVRPVTNRSDLWAFLDLPFRLYADDGNWIAPLYRERYDALNPRKNPYFEHAEVQLWLAERDGRPVGRLSTQIDRLARERIDPGLGHFGLFECDDDEAVVSALFETGEAWLRERGTTAVTGPFNLSINEECGLLVDGFDTPPFIMMPHGRPAYDRLVTAQGYAKARDLYALDLDLAPGFGPRIRRIVAAAKRNPRIRSRQVDLARLEEDVRIIFDIFNDAWSDNWGFVPITDKELAHAASQLRPLIAPYRCQICYYDDEPAAFMLAIPDLNHAIRDLRGRLLPLGWAKLAYRLLLKGPTQVRVPLMGVRKRFRGTPASAAMALMLITDIRDDCWANGIRRGELGWLLEDNHGIHNLLAPLGADRYKTYRLYHKALG